MQTSKVIAKSGIKKINFTFLISTPTFARASFDLSTFNFDLALYSHTPASINGSIIRNIQEMILCNITQSRCLNCLRSARSNSYSAAAISKIPSVISKITYVIYKSAFAISKTTIVISKSIIVISKPDIVISKDGNVVSKTHSAVSKTASVSEAMLRKDVLHLRTDLLHHRNYE